VRVVLKFEVCGEVANFAQVGDDYVRVVLKFEVCGEVANFAKVGSVCEVALVCRKVYLP